ncbi:unnamed protein product, partial [Ranitomeya imitator]
NMSTFEKQLHLGRLPPRPPMPGGLQSGSKMRMGPGRKRDFSPVPWSQYFESMEDVIVESETAKDISLTRGPETSGCNGGTHSFRVYKSGSDGPILLLLHGGGHSALSWAVFTVSTDVETNGARSGT